MGVIFHEVYPQPCPLFVPGTKGTISRQAQTQITQDPGSAGFLGQIDTLIKGLQSVWAEEAPSATALKDKIKAQRTHILKSLTDLKKACSQAQAAAERLRIPKASKLIVKAKTCIGRAENKTRTKWKQGATVMSVEGVHTDVIEAINTLKQIKDLWVPTVKSKNALPARLNQQIFRPDVWFSAPPRCNVIFPEHFFTLNYRRDFLQEPTRLMLKTNDEFFGEDQLFDCFYFAPKLEGLKRGGTDLYKMLQGDILAHEVYTGIMPVFEKMGEFNIFGIRSGSAPQADKKDKAKKQPVRKPKIGLAQRSTNFLFFRYRFGARAMSIQGVFNPYIACGFPGLIIDKYVDLARLKKMRDAMVVSGFKYRPLTDMLGTHFLGNFSNVVHSLSQSEGGRTEIQVQFPREYNEDLEYLGASNKVTREVEKKLDAGALRETDVAAIDPPPFGALGPNFGPIASVKNVTSAYASAGDRGGQTLPVYGGPRRKGTGELTLKVPIGVTKKASAWGPDIESAVGDPNKDVTFRAYRVKEMVPRYRQEKILMPAEELIRPGWYGDCWHPAQIGKVYEQFFRTGAITDPQQVSDSSGAGTYIGQEGMDDALSQAAAGRDPEDPRRYAPAIMSLEQEATIQQAVSFLLQTYSYIRMNDLSADDFIRSYTWRPIASIVDMFGSSDLEFDARGEKVIKGIEGFHSRAFGPYSDLFNLVTDEVEKVLGVSRGSRLAKKVDTRRAKFDAVQDYVQLLMASRAILG
jgi:hypothetical protein